MFTPSLTAEHGAASCDLFLPSKRFTMKMSAEDGRESEFQPDKSWIDITAVDDVHVDVARGWVSWVGSRRWLATVARDGGSRQGLAAGDGDCAAPFTWIPRDLALYLAAVYLTNGMTPTLTPTLRQASSMNVRNESLNDPPNRTLRNGRPCYVYTHVPTNLHRWTMS